MSGTDTPDLPDDQDLDAAEYVLGTLPIAEARALAARAMTDATLAASIADWEARLAPLTNLVAPVPAPPILWRRLALAAGIDSVIQAPPPRRAQGAVGLWRAATLAAMAVAASLAYLLYYKPAPGPEPLMAALSPYGAPGATFLVRVGADGTATVVAIGDTKLPPGRALELWALASGATAPVSLGLLPESGRAQLTVPAQPGTQLLVSQEPAGGSPTKQPTGPVVYAGRLTGI